MARLYIAEYNRMAQIGNSAGQCPEEPPLVEQVIDFTGGTPQSAFFQPTTSYLRLNCDAPCSILVGFNPTASTNNQRLAGNQTEYKGVKTGGQFRLSVVANT